MVSLCITSVAGVVGDGTLGYTSKCWKISFRVKWKKSANDLHNFSRHFIENFWHFFLSFSDIFTHGSTFWHLWFQENLDYLKNFLTLLRITRSFCLYKIVETTHLILRVNKDSSEKSRDWEKFPTLADLIYFNMRKFSKIKCRFRICS